MVCNRCKEDGVFVQMNTFSYWYCRQCKDEIYLERANKDETVNKDAELDMYGVYVMDNEGNTNKRSFDDDLNELWKISDGRGTD